jgi:hypothetical protein
MMPVVLNGSRVTSIRRFRRFTQMKRPPGAAAKRPVTCTGTIRQT